MLLLQGHPTNKKNYDFNLDLILSPYSKNIFLLFNKIHTIFKFFIPLLAYEMNKNTMKNKKQEKPRLTNSLSCLLLELLLSSSVTLTQIQPLWNNLEVKSCHFLFPPFKLALPYYHFYQHNMYVFKTMIKINQNMRFHKDLLSLKRRIYKVFVVDSSIRRKYRGSRVRPEIQIQMPSYLLAIWIPCKLKHL